MKKVKGLFAFEGIGGSGKSTQAEMLARAFRQNHSDVLLTCEHTRDRPFGMRIEEVIKGKVGKVDLLALQLGYTADRRDHWAGDVEPVVSRGGIVVTDRWYGSTVAYISPDYRELLLQTNQAVVGRPELTFIVDLDPVTAVARVYGRGGEDMFDKIETLNRCREGYRWFMEKSGDECVWINGQMSIEEIHGQIMEEIKRRGILK
jgi:dTMP kinase